MPTESLDYLKAQLAELDRAGSAIHPRTLEGEQSPRARFDGRDVINLASNNYLGLAAHPRLKEAAAKAAREFGAGSGAVRTIAGTMTLHRELEKRFAAFKGADDAIMFQSGFTANSGTVGAILTKEDVIVSDQLNHASIVDGARLSRAEIKVFPHKDASAADELLEETKREGRRQLLITDGVFSMDGDITPLPGLVDIAERHGAIMMVDDAHSSGILGRAGRGTMMTEVVLRGDDEPFGLAYAGFNRQARREGDHPNPDIDEASRRWGRYTPLDTPLVETGLAWRRDNRSPVLQAFLKLLGKTS